MKRKLKKFALITLGCVVAIFAVWRLHLSYSVNRQLAALRAAGLPTSGEELNEWYAAVPDFENAALQMIQAFRLRREFPAERAKEWSTFESPPGQPLTEHQRQFLADYVEMNADALAKATEAVRLPKSRYPIDFSFGANPSAERLTILLGFAHLWEYEALLALDSGKPDRTETCVATLLDAAHTLDDEPITLAQLIRRDLLWIASDLLQRDLSANSRGEEGLSDLMNRFTAAEKTGLFARALIGERAWAIPDFLRSRPEDPRIAEARKKGIEIHNSLPWSGTRPWWLRLSGILDCDLRFYLTTMETNIALLKLGPPRSLATGDLLETAIRDTTSPPVYWISFMKLMEMTRLARAEAGGLAKVCLARTALAVERFRSANRRLPENLGELVPQFLAAAPVDPFDGQPLRYHALPKGYVIYSVDSDGVDNGGREWQKPVKSTDKTAFDMTFAVER